MTPRRARPGFLLALGITVIGVIALVAAIQIFGASAGEPCRDSYSCRGFLVSGAECVVEPDGAYCTRYCDADADCPPAWRCRGAEPTALGIETGVLDEVCLRP